MADDDDGGLATYDTDLNGDYLTAISCVAIVTTSAVLLTGIVFPALRKREIYFQLILLMSFCDFIFALTGSWGSPTTMAMCTIQAGCKTFFTTSSWMFVLFLTVTIFCHFQFRRRYLKLTHMVIISFGVALLVTCLPLTDPDITYSSRVLFDSNLSCIMGYNYETIHDDDGHKLAEKYMTFLLWQMLMNNVLPLTIIAIMFGLCAFLYLVTLPSISEEDPSMALRMKRLVNYIVLYPVAMTICFGPAAGCGIWVYINSPLFRTVTLLKIQIALEANIYSYGFAASLIFFFNASSARQMWRRWLVRRIGKPLCGMEEEEDLLKDLTLEESEHNVGISSQKDLWVRRGKPDEDDIDYMDDDDIDRALSLIFSDHESVGRRSSYMSRGSAHSAARSSHTSNRSGARSSHSSNKSGVDRLSSFGWNNPIGGGLATAGRASAIAEENPSADVGDTRIESQWEVENRNKPLSVRGSVAYDSGSEAGAESRHRMSNASLGARLSSFRDTIPEADGTGVTMNPIVGEDYLQEEDEDDQGYGL